MKKLLTVVLCAVLVLGLAVPAAAASGTVDYVGVTIEVDGVLICPMDANGDPVEPFIYNGSTYLPVRSVANALGLNVNWNNGVVELTSGGSGVVAGAPVMSWRSRSIDMGGADVKVTLNGTELALKDAAGRPVTPIVSGGVTYLPVRAIADALNVAVEWDAENTTVYLGQRVEWLRTKCTTTDADGETTVDTWRCDSKGNLLEEVLDYGDYTARTTYTYDAAGNLTREHYEDNDPEYPYSYTDTYVYDGAGNLVKETNEEKTPKSQESYTTTYTYDAAGNLLSEETVDNLLPKSTPEKTVYTYNAKGQCVSEKWTSSYGYEYETLYEYDAAGNLVKETEKGWYGNDTVTTYTYDGAGNLLSSYEDEGDGDYDKYEYTYDTAGRVLTEYNEYTYYGEMSFDKSTYTYDRDGNVLSEIYEYNYDGETSRSEYYYTYDDRGNCTSSRRVYDGVTGYEMTTEYDKFDNIVRGSANYDGEKMEYSYRYTYDEGGKILRAVSVGGLLGNSMITYEYDKAGNVLKMQTVNGLLRGDTATYEYISVKK